MKKRSVLACLLAVIMIIMMVPFHTEAAVEKPGKVTITSTKGYVAKDADSVGIAFRWNTVSGAAGYQYRYNLFWNMETSKPDSFTTKTTKKTSVVIGFQDNTNVYFQIRAYKIEKKNGKEVKVYGKWTTRKIKEDAVASMIRNVQEPTDIQYVMYLGTNDKDTNQPVFAPEEAKEKAIAILLKHFGGYTIQEADGGWIDGETVYKEFTLVIYLSDTTLDKVHGAAKELIDTFHQSSVLIQANRTTTEFYYGNR